MFQNTNNVSTLPATCGANSPETNSFEQPVNTVNTRYRERDFGVGYGRSSGYASRRSYVENSIQNYFRCS